MQAVLLTVSMTAAAGNEAKAYKIQGLGNPISSCVFCADPTALVYKGRLYVYGSNDHQQYIKNNKTGNNGYGDIKSLVVFSTDDMTNWTFHGTIDVGTVCKWAGNSWAPSATWRTNADGVDEFFIYFANGASNVGVMKSNSPVGEFTSPRNSAMIAHGMPGVDPCSWLFDPGVVVDKDGTGWIAFGGGDPQSSGSDLMPGNSRIAKLMPSMTELDGSAVNLPAPYMFEASELNIINNKFVYTFNTSWSERNDWGKYAKRGDYEKPSTCSMCYMVTDTPLNPDSWEYRGEYFPNPGNFGWDWGNNHTHLQEFEGKYYLIYHAFMLEKSMKEQGGYSASGFRSIAVNEATVDESTLTISSVKATSKGVDHIRNLNPFELQQAETMSTCGGVNYEDFTNIVRKPTLNSLGNDASRPIQVKMRAGSWTMVRKADFSKQVASSFMVRAKGTGAIEVRLSVTGVPVARVEFSSESFEDHVVDIDPKALTDITSLYFVCTEAQSVQFDAWQFFSKTPDGIKETVNVNDGKPANRFDLSGRQLPSAGQQHGVVIEQFVNDKGVKASRKRLGR